MSELNIKTMPPAIASVLRQEIMPNSTVPLVAGTAKATYFVLNSVINLNDHDFNEKQITIKNTSCVLVLFYVENDESYKLLDIWSTVSSKVPGPTWAACNLILNPRIAKTFQELANKGHNPYKNFTLNSIPVIIVYNGGEPVGYYNGDLTVQKIAEFSLTLACTPSYSEKFKTTNSITVDETSVSMLPPPPPPPKNFGYGRPIG